MMASQPAAISQQPSIEPLLDSSAFTNSAAAVATPPPWVFGMPQSDGSSAWMAKFCVEPDGDAATCCLGWFVPCALYGKTHWRLEQLRKDKDPLDTSWKCSYGCNGPCWLFYLLGVYFTGTLGSCELSLNTFAKNYSNNILCDYVIS
jgi:hypothetical protein